jgi:hypothetical protein
VRVEKLIYLRLGVAVGAQEELRGEGVHEVRPGDADCPRGSGTNWQGMVDLPAHGVPEIQLYRLAVHCHFHSGVPDVIGAWPIGGRTNYKTTSYISFFLSFVVRCKNPKTKFLLFTICQISM